MDGETLLRGLRGQLGHRYLYASKGLVGAGTPDTASALGYALGKHWHASLLAKTPDYKGPAGIELRQSAFHAAPRVLSSTLAFRMHMNLAHTVGVLRSLAGRLRRAAPRQPAQLTVNLWVAGKYFTYRYVNITAVLLVTCKLHVFLFSGIFVMYDS